MLTHVCSPYMTHLEAFYFACLFYKVQVDQEHMQSEMKVNKKKYRGKLCLILKVPIQNHSHDPPPEGRADL